MGIHFREQESFVRIVELTPALRKRIEATIEHLLSILDQFDGDETMEDDGGGEPWLGWTGDGPQRLRAGAFHDDREHDDADYEDGADAEPSLGANENHPVPYGHGRDGTGNQYGWMSADTRARVDECELENEHEDGADEEPSCGWPDEVNQASMEFRWSAARAVL